MKRMLASLGFALGLILLTVGLYTDQLNHLETLMKSHGVP